MILSKKKKYLQIALNSTEGEAQSIIYQLPKNERIIIEAGTPLIKRYGISIISKLSSWWLEGFNVSQPPPYVVADLKTMDRGETEVIMAKEAGASAAIGLGQAPIETINCFIETCKKTGNG